MYLKKMSSDKIAINIIGYAVLIIGAFLCIIPFWMILVGSFSNNNLVNQLGFSIWTRGFSMQAYRTVFVVPTQILNAYKTSTIVTVCGTLVLLFIQSMGAYVLSRRDYKYRNKFSFFFFFTTIFSGGLVPWYMLCNNYLKFSNLPIVAMVTPMLFNYFYIIIMRTFMSGIPDSLTESAKIDGANDFRIYAQIIIPLSKPVLATVGLFAALSYWNDWYNAMLFSNTSVWDNWQPLQYFLYTIINRMQGISNFAQAAGFAMGQMPTETFKLATTIIATGPILLVYPFVQKYFVKGIMIGAVKG